tara:strand:+ start:3278 stop:3592 length:315 start_codon:yes stop_codon:yes gene_type:complete
MKKFKTVSQLRNTNLMQLNKDIKQFKNYCNDFYNINKGVYKIATLEEITNAINIYLWCFDGVIEFDSIDRENVRQIIEETQRQTKEDKKQNFDKRLQSLINNLK